VTATSALTSDLQRQVLVLEDDLRRRVAADPELEGCWKQEHQRALEKERTASPWVAWRDDRVTQAAVAWVLTSVFIRFCEDNALVTPVWISGPESRRQEALDAQLTYFRTHPEDTDREWLLQAVGHLEALPATVALVDSRSALHLVSPSGDAVTALLDFWRRRGDDGTLVHDLADVSLSTRFLGDLYQELSQYAKDTYALLQTPMFVEEFILDRTLEPALAERPLEGFKLIDPTCGSGHFLLGAFERLLDRWHRHAPGLEIQAQVQAALDAIHGVDLNPFAVAIARFRLTVAALKSSGLSSLEDAPAFTFHLAVGDSLIHGPDRDVLPGMSDRNAFMPFTYVTEDGPLLLTLLEEGRYDVVVGNPPYITVKDKALSQIYRSKYTNVCKGKYALTVPFMALFFALAKEGDFAGWVGQITSNSFMKREFGSPLVENFLIRQDLRLVADTSGAYIPGHGTPTVIIVGRNHKPVSRAVRAVLGVQGEPGRPEEPAKGMVWTTMVNHVDTPGWDDRWISVVDLDRGRLATHPWSLVGGGAGDVEQRIEEASPTRLGQRIQGKIGPASFPGADDCFFAPRSALTRRGISTRLIREVITGDVVRDWSVLPGESALVPYADMVRLLALDTSSAWYKWLWPNRTILGAIVGFDREARASADVPWWSWYRWVSERYRTPLSLCFAVVATQNHLALVRGTGVFNRHAPVIKLSDVATENDHLALLGVLNSSAACFWLKQNSHGRGNGGVNEGFRGDDWEEFYEFTGTTLQEYPLPRVLPLDRAQLLDGLAQEFAANEASAICVGGTPSLDAVTAACRASDKIRAQMISVQEELDWECYRLYGLIDEDMTYGGHGLPGLALGQRAFEIALQKAVQAGEEETTWFTRHGSTPITDIPEPWPPAYRDLVQRRLDLIASNPWIRLLEKPEYKRRWASESWERRQERALRGWLLDRLEDRQFWLDGQGRPLPRNVAQLADEVSRDADMMSVLALWEGRPDVAVTQSLVRLLADEAVPYLAAYRYKDSGLRRREAWEQMWALQRREDSGEKVGPIPVPPKYTAADFRKGSYWQARGKLDVPKERFILYPDAGRETDPTPLLGWAGWDHAQQSLALSLIIGERERDGWEDERLIPLVAGLAELQPWVEQWHGEVDLAYGVSLAAFCREQLTARAAQVGKTLPELAAWRPEPPRRGRRSRAAG
jgi:Domain of unknown function (DUF7008)/Eco57I restriction-modification methylase